MRRDEAPFKSKIKERNRLYALNLRATGGLVPVAIDRLRVLTSEVGHLRQQLKKSFFSKQLSEAGRDSRAAWRVLHDFIGKVVVLPLGKLMPSVDYFWKLIYM